MKTPGVAVLTLVLSLIAPPLLVSADKTGQVWLKKASLWAQLNGSMDQGFSFHDLSVNREKIVSDVVGDLRTRPWKQKKIRLKNRH